MTFPSSLNLTVRRRDAVLVAPAKPTPHEFKLLSDIDDQQGLLFQVPFIQLYRSHPSKFGREPARVIRDALAEALVFYYPCAGRIRGDGGRKLAVECTGEGVVFVEAEAEVRLEELGDDALKPPFPWLDEVLFDVPGTSGIINSPLLLIQVTRFTCGGFIFALRVNHAIIDGPGLLQFMTALADIAGGALAPSVLPVWDRHLLYARNPPRVTCTHREYEQVDDPDSRPRVPLYPLVHRSFSFGRREIAVLRSHLPPELRSCSTFDLLTACFWRCRTLALQLHLDEQVRLIVGLGARHKFQPPIPAGYYGNAATYPASVAPAGELCRRPLGYAVELVSRAKKEATTEFLKSAADLLVTSGRPHFTVAGTCMVADMRHMDFGGVDFGWGRAVYCGPAKAGLGPVPGYINFFLPLREKARNENVLLCCLPEAAMGRFVVEMERMVMPMSAL